MKETEVKILEINRAKIEKTLTGLNAKKIFNGNIQTLFFDFKDRSMSKQGKLLRLRKNAQKTELTYKKVKHTKIVKIAEEYSVEISNMETMAQILQNLGLSVTEKMEKYRLSYKIDNAQFDIDHYTGNYAFVPEFLEIEAENIDQIHKYARLLGFNPKDCLPWSTEELIQHYSSKKKAEKNRPYFAFLVSLRELEPATDLTILGDTDFLAGFFETFQEGYSPCSFLKLSRSSCCNNCGCSLTIQLITTFSRNPSLSNIEFIFLAALPPYPARYPPKTLL